MRLHRIELSNWRGLEHLTIEDLAGDLNLVAGPNMAGKSRLFGALHAVFFESHKGAAAYKKAYRSWTGDSAPEVEVSFSLDHTRYTLHKRFLDKPFAELTTAKASWSGEEAEGRLAELLGARPPGSRRVAATAQDMGLWPLVWVRQHDSHVPPHIHLTDAARAKIQDVLAGEVGAVAAGPLGQHILERARKEADKYWTATWKQTGELRAAEKQATAATEAAREARERRDAAHARADELGEKRQGLEDQSRRLAALRARKQELGITIEGAEKLEQDQKQAAHEVTEAARLLEEARRALTAHNELEVSLATARTERAKIAAALDGLRADLAEREEKLRSAEAAVLEAEEAWKRAREAQRHALAAARRRALDKVVADLGDRVDKVEALDEKRRAAEDAISRIKVDQERLEAIQRAEGDVIAARARLEAASARLSIEALADVEIDGEPHAPGTRWSVTIDSVRSVRIGDAAKVTVEPGSEGLEARRDALRDASAELGELLAAAAVETADAAREALAQRSKLERERDLLNTKIEALAADGVGSLRDELESASRERDAIEGASPDALDEETARELEDDARQRVDTERSARDTVKESISGARTEEATLREKLVQAAGAVTDGEKKLAEEPERAQLEASAAARQDDLGKAERRVEQIEAELEERGVGAAREEHERVERGISKLEEARSELQRRVSELEGILRELGGERLHEALQDAEAHLSDTERALERVRAHAAAAKRLVEALEDARTQVQQQLWAPIRKRIQPYLARILPEHEIVLNESWELVGVQAEGQEMPLDDLSGGTHEQLSVIVRVALAEAIAGDARLPVILDDPLVHSDRDRHNAMLGVLSEASRHLQVIVLTCHQADFDKLGESRRYLLERSGRVTRV